MSGAKGGPGALVALVGPSGVGKDSLLARVRERFAEADGVHVARRVITRAAASAPEAEPHESVDEAGFAQRLARGDFAVHWQAHGLHYGVPSDVLERLAAGHVVVVNGSRAALPRFAEIFSTLLVVHVTVDAATLAHRLAARGRESEAAIRRRLARAAPLDPALAPRVRELDNGGSLDATAERLIGWLEALRPAAASGTAAGTAADEPARPVGASGVPAGPFS